MRLFNIFIKKNAENKIEDILLVKEGFSWRAFIFSNLWFLYHRMWKEFLALCVMSIFFAIFADSWVIFDKIILELAFALVIGLNANYWLVNHLLRKNYQFCGIVFGNNLAEAKLNLIREYGDSLDVVNFDSSIINPQLYKKISKTKKSQPYFTV
jgi:hypothetical protein